jgi:Protein of unknown function (DUF4231)
MIDESTYLKTRVDDQISWLSKKSGTNQRWYKWFRLLEIGAAGAVPLLVGFRDNHPSIPVIIGCIGVMLVILQGVHHLYKFRDKWTEYRSAAEALKREKYLFEAGVPPYHDANGFKTFVRNVETILGMENMIWKYNVLGKADEQAKKNPEAVVTSG